MKKIFLCFVVVISMFFAFTPMPVYAGTTDCSLTYDTNGGIGGPDKVSFTKYQTNYRLATTPKPTHSDDDGIKVVFVGWSESQTPTILKKDDDPRMTMRSIRINSDVVVYAVWGYDANNDGIADALASKTVTFLDDDGSVISTNSKYQYGYTVNVPADLKGKADKNKYWVFNGWSPTVENTVKKDATYTATYTEHTFDKVNIKTNLQVLIDNASDGDTITLEDGKIYKGNITINKQIKITSVKRAFIDGKINIPSTVSGTGAITIEKCVISGGVEVVDGQAKLTLFENTIYYNDTTPAFKVVGTPDSTKKHASQYTIGSIYEPTSYRTVEYPNTFINEGTTDDYEKGIKAALAIDWPFTTYNDGTSIKEDRLDVYASYWKKGNIKTNANFWDVRATGDFGKVPRVDGRPTRWDGYVKYSLELFIRPKEFPQKFYDLPEGRILPPENFPWRVGIDEISKRTDENTNDRIYLMDVSLVLYKRSFHTNGTAGAFFQKIESYGAHIHNMESPILAGPKLPKPHVFEYKMSYIYTDSDYGIPYSDPMNLILGDGLYLYTNNSTPFLPMDIKPKATMAYAGTGTLSKSFPTNENEFIIDNIYYDETVTDAPLDKKSIDPRKKYLIFPESAYGQVILGTPLSTKVYQDSEEIISNSKGGKYSIKVSNAQEMLNYNVYLDSSVFGFCGFTPSDWIQWFKTNTPETEVIIRPTSGNLTVEPVVEILPTNLTSPLAIVDKDAKYYDSTKGISDAVGQQLEEATVSLLNDNEEPTANHYSAMLQAVKTNPVTKNKAYKHHYLSLLNTNDGNNVVTTSSEKKIFIPYPSDYKQGTNLNIMYFNDYNRMPTDTITTNTIIPNSAITKLESGFTFSTTSHLGAYIIAYEKNDSHGEDDKTQHTLSFETNGGKSVSSITKDNGGKIIINQVTTREGYTFDGWYEDENFTIPVSEVILNSDKIIYAKWKKVIIDSTDNPKNESHKKPTVKPSSPKDKIETSDQNHLLIWTSSILISGICIFYLRRRIKLRKKNDISK